MTYLVCDVYIGAREKRKVLYSVEPMNGFPRTKMVNAKKVCTKSVNISPDIIYSVSRHSMHNGPHTHLPSQ